MIVSPPAQLLFYPPRYSMPAVPAPALVLISGINGYVGVWVATKYLEHGYSVRGTVRSIEKAGKHLYDLFSKYGDRFELVEVKDITSKGAFDEAVKGVDVVAHTVCCASHLILLRLTSAIGISLPLQVHRSGGHHRASSQGYDIDLGIHPRTCADG